MFCVCVWWLNAFSRYLVKIAVSLSFSSLHLILPYVYDFESCMWQWNTEYSKGIRKISSVLWITPKHLTLSVIDNHINHRCSGSGSLDQNAQIFTNWTKNTVLECKPTAWIIAGIGMPERKLTHRVREKAQCVYICVMFTAQWNKLRHVCDVLCILTIERQILLRWESSEYP